MKLNFYIYTLILLFLLLMQCSSTSFIDNGIIVNGIKSVNPNVRIVARDKSFEITASKLTKLTEINHTLSTTVDPSYPYEHHFFQIVNDYPKVYGKEVFIHIAGRSEPYYGILDINSLAPDAVGPIVEQKQYEIKIPELLFGNQYSLNGRSVVVYEHYAIREKGDVYLGLGKKNFKAWTLWISDKPLYVYR